jgi:hypothetical protein
MSQRMNFILPDRYAQELRQVAQQTGLTLTEVLRRMMDHCLQGPVLNQLVPCMSGSLVTNNQN